MTKYLRQPLIVISSVLTLCIWVIALNLVFTSYANAGGLTSITPDPVVKPPEARQIICTNINTVPNFNGRGCVMKDPDEDRIFYSTEERDDDDEDCGCEHVYRPGHDLPPNLKEWLDQLR